MRMPPPVMAMGNPPPGDGRRVSSLDGGVEMERGGEIVPRSDYRGEEAPVVSGNQDEIMEEEQNSIKEEDMSLDEGEEEEDTGELEHSQTHQEVIQNTGQAPCQPAEIKQETLHANQESNQETDQLPQESNLETSQDSQECDQTGSQVYPRETMTPMETGLKAKDPTESPSLQPTEESISRASQEVSTRGLSPATSSVQQVPSESIDSVDIDAMLDNVEQDKPSGNTNNGVILAGME